MARKKKKSRAAGFGAVTTTIVKPASEVRDDTATSWWDRNYGSCSDSDTGSSWSFWSTVGKKEEGKSYSSYWSSRYEAYGTSYYSSGDSKYDKYIEILRSIRRSANVVGTTKDASGNDREIKVQWAGEECRNSTRSDTVYLSPQVVDGKDSSEGSKWTQDERQDVLIAEALTESTLKRTMDSDVEDSMVASLKDPEHKEYARRVLAHHLWNVLERLHAESEVTGEYPGFTGYFAAYRSYYTSPGAFEALSKLLKEDECTGSAIKALFWELLHPEKHLEASPKLTDALKYAFDEISKVKSSDQRAQTSRRIVDDFFRRWPNDCIDDKGGRTPERDAREQSDPYLQFFKGLTQDEKTPADKAGGDARLGDKVAPRSEAIKGDARVAGSDHGDEYGVYSPAEAASTLDELSDFKEGILNVSVPGTGFAKKYADLRQSLLAPITALRSQLKLRNEDNRMLEHGLRKGRLDEGSLYKLGIDDGAHADHNVFEIEEAASPPRIALCILVDESGSMSANVYEKRGGVDTYSGFTRMEAARDTAIIVSEAVRGFPDLEVCVLGHSGQGRYLNGHTDKLVVNHYLTPDLPNNRVSLASSRAWVENLDGYALAYVAKKMLSWYDDTYTKVIVHISDGEPLGKGYGGEPAYRHVYKSCVAAKREGVRILGIGICNPFTPAMGQKLYGMGNCVILPDARASIPLGNFLRNMALRKAD